jgi:acyl-ACP thioesterase
MGVMVEPIKIDLSNDWGEDFSVHSHTVRFNETDTYQHMNNTFYGDLITNALYINGVTPTPYEWKNVQINYISEMRLGDTAEIKCRKNENGYRIAGENEGKPVFSAVVT